MMFPIQVSRWMEECSIFTFLLFQHLPAPLPHQPNRPGGGEGRDLQFRQECQEVGEGRTQHNPRGHRHRSPLRRRQA